MIYVVNFECQFAQESIHTSIRLAHDLVDPDGAAHDLCPIDHLLAVEILEVSVNCVVPTCKIWGICGSVEHDELVHQMGVSNEFLQKLTLVLQNSIIIQ